MCIGILQDVVEYSIGIHKDKLLLLMKPLIRAFWDQHFELLAPAPPSLPHPFANIEVHLQVQFWQCSNCEVCFNVSELHVQSFSNCLGKGVLF